MTKKNCWEVKKCGREPGGLKVRELGVCPAAESTAANGIHGGRKGGRACWVVTGTLCGNQVQGNFATKVGKCMSCEFFRQVQAEEGRGFIQASEILRLIS